ncbi:NAD(P)-dependent oxidoreductase [Frigidibacter sp.]|uniref:NAD-dependent epimerase/dehydratase family protein n=1 Tax=Frigidibacter sp. TaxID=2586418 RepID=UPI002732FF37|nr:NAD(P)-dependent oxidoreductase [Frigidibacter sp.]MDP3342565.1 NAD(P)-dependent oxidoreductase [Frigidibacter sp.]
MKIALTGGTGLVGRFLAEAARAAGHEVTLLSRTPQPGGMRYDLTGSAPNLSGHDALIHAAFQHAPGRYRGGEGTDPEGFLAANRDGSLRLFAAAREAGVARALFLSTRAVYGDHPAGTVLTEDLELRPDTLYGQMKADVEQGLAALSSPSFLTASLRATGVYGPGPNHKWTDLFKDFRAGRTITPRVATEVHGDDLAAAALLLLDAPAEALASHAFNVSDLTLDLHDLLAEVARLTGCTAPLPPRADAGQVSAMDCTRLRDLGWQPGGWPLLRGSLPSMLG